MGNSKSNLRSTPLQWCELHTVQCEDNPKLYRLVDKDTPEQKEFKQACYNTAEELEKKDYDELYKFLREHIQEWWD